MRGRTAGVVEACAAAARWRSRSRPSPSRRTTRCSRPPSPPARAAPPPSRRAENDRTATRARSLPGSTPAGHRAPLRRCSHATYRPGKQHDREQLDHGRPAPDRAVGPRLRRQHRRGRRDGGRGDGAVGAGACRRGRAVAGGRACSRRVAPSRRTWCCRRSSRCAAGAGLAVVAGGCLPSFPLVPGGTVPSPHGGLVAFWQASGCGAIWARWFADRLPFTNVGLSQLARLADGFLIVTPLTAPPWALGPELLELAERRLHQVERQRRVAVRARPGADPCTASS